jgi:hypothetical protein
MTAFMLEGGGARWHEFEERLEDFVAAAGRAVVLAQKVLRRPGVNFSEYTDPAFAGLVERRSLGTRAGVTALVSVVCRR